MRSYWGMSKRLYADRKSPDGIVSHGWRYVRKRGVKFGGAWYTSDKLKEISVGEYVNVGMSDYWRTEVDIQRGAYGALSWFCKANAVLK